MTAEGSAAASDGVRVAVRVRPLNERERALVAAGAGGAAGISWALTVSSMTQIVDQRPVAANSFAFDHVFLEGIDNETVYKSLAAPVVLSAVEGINGVIFAYGQTAAGKTHTMLGNESDPGITRRSISDLFSAIAASRGRGFLLRASYIEIYNEVIMDLLAAGGENLKIHEDVVNKRVYVNAKEEVVTSVQDVMDMLAAGEQARAVGVTNMNERSSRSHTIFTLRIESRELRPTDDGAALDDDDDDGVAVRASTLTLVDLAGSERVAFTKAEGIRLKEGGHINKSLLTLGTVINKLSSGESRSAAHIPYRDSKLTRILQPALGGNARTAIVCAVTPSLVHMDETLSTLRFASRAKKVTNHAQTNEYLDDRAKLRRAEKEIERLKAENAAIRKSAGASDGAAGDSGALAEAAQSQLQKSAQKRIQLFEQKFEKLCALSPIDDAAPHSRASSASAQSAPGAPVASRASMDSRSVPEVADGWDTRPLLRDALDLCGVPARRPSGSFAAEAATAGGEGNEKGDADLRMRALQAERALAQAKSEIEWERHAMAGEVDSLVVAADEAQRARNKAQAEAESMMSLLARAQTASLVDEMLEGAMMISERDGKIEAAEKEIRRIEGVQAELVETAAKLANVEKQLAEALKREKRGVGPVLKEKAALQTKLTDAEGKLRSVRQSVSKITSEKAVLEREVKTKEKQNKMLSAEVEKHRKHKGMADARVAKQHADEKKKLEGELQATKEENISMKGIVAAQKSKIEGLQKDYVAVSVEVAEKSGVLEELEGKMKETTDELDGSKKNAEELTGKLAESEAQREKHIASSTEELEKLKAELAEKEASLTASKEESEQRNEALELTKKELEELQTKHSALEKEHEKYVETSTVQIAELQTEMDKLKVTLQECEEKSAADTDKLSGELVDVHLRLEQFKAMAETAEKELAEKKAEIEELDNSLAKRKENVETLETAIASKSLEIEELSKSLAESRTEVDIAHEEVKLRKDHMEAMEKALAESKILCGEKQKLLEGAQAKQTAAEKTFRELCSELENEQKKSTEAQNAAKENADHVDSLEEKLSAEMKRAEDLCSNVRELEDAQIALEQEKRNTQKRLGSQQQESEIIQHKFNAREQELVQQAKQLQMEMEDLGKALQERESEMENCASCKALSDELRKLQKEVGEGLRHSTRGVKTAREQMERRSAELESGMTRLAKRNEGLLKEGEAAMLEKIRLVESLQKTKDQYHKLEMRLHELKQGDGPIKKLEKRVRRRDDRIAILESQLAYAEGANAARGSREEWATVKRVVELEAQEKSMQVENERLETCIRCLEGEKVSLVEESHKLRMKIKERELVWTNSLRERREKDMLELRRECKACGDTSSFVVRV